MDIYDMYIAKNENTKIYLPQIKDIFTSDKNKNYLFHIISRELYVSNNDTRYLQLQVNIDNEINNWIASGIFNKLENTAGIVSNEITLQLNYYNNLFIKNYINKATKLNQYQFELDNNPYKQEININGEKKKFKDFLASDYENMNVSNYQETFTLNGNFNEKYNRIPKYRTELHRNNVDRSFSGNNMPFDSKVNIKYKKYNNDDLLHNLSYLRKK